MQSHLKVPPLGRKAFEKVMSGERKLLSALFWAWAKIEHEEHFGYVRAAATAAVHFPFAPRGE